MSTPIDVAFGLLLVGAAVAVLAGINPAVPDTPEDRGSALLGSQMDVTYETANGPARVSGTMGGLVGDAVRAGVGTPGGSERAFRQAVRETVADRVTELGLPIQITGYCRNPAGQGARLDVGQTVPSDRPIQATVYHLPPEHPSATDQANQCRPAVVVRRWSE